MKPAEEESKKGANNVITKEVMKLRNKTNKK
jgi:hypothetical protein